jgi:hypothetical protein
MPLGATLYAIDGTDGRLDGRVIRQSAPVAPTIPDHRARRSEW